MSFLQVKNQTSNNRRSLDPFTAMFYEMDRLFNDLGRAETSPTVAQQQYQWSPACDISEQDGAYLVEVDLPGIREEDIAVEVKGKHLAISANRSKESRETRDSGFRSERLFGSFQRTFALPEDVDAEKIEAQYKNGVLSIALPKRPHALPRKIEIGQGQKEGGLLQKLFGKGETNDTTAH
jgi:HSP20 family protein